MKRILTVALGLVVCGTTMRRAARPDTSGLDVIQVRPNFYLIAGAGGNIGVQIGSDGVVLLRRRLQNGHPIK